MENLRNEFESIGFRLSRASKILRRFIDNRGKDKGLDDFAVLHGWILGYLKNKQDEDVYQKDLEKKFHIAKSHVTGILKNFEQMGWIVREEVEKDARLKKIVLTDDGHETVNQLCETIKECEEELYGVLNETEREQFFNCLEKIENYMKGKVD